MPAVFGGPFHRAESGRGASGRDGSGLRAIREGRKWSEALQQGRKWSGGPLAGPEVVEKLSGRAVIGQEALRQGRNCSAGPQAGS